MRNISGDYCYSFDGERYYGEFESEDEAIKAAKRDDPDRNNVYIGTATEPVLRWNSNEEQIIESIMDNLADDVGEWAENFDVSSEDELALAKMIDEAVEAWINQNKIHPNCYQVLDDHEVSLKDRT